jgi:hypothetical protein
MPGFLPKTLVILRIDFIVRSDDVARHAISGWQVSMLSEVDQSDSAAPDVH